MDIIILLILLALGYFFGRMAENKHFKSIVKREKATLHVPMMTMKTIPNQDRLSINTGLVSGNVVISVDYFKRFLAGLRNLVGGRVKSYESLLDRARREALLRMKEQAMSNHAAMVVNVRVETSSISKSSRRQQSIGSVEVFAYGTAIYITS